jgi:hypothetical protein
VRDREVDEELAFHLDLRAAELMAQRGLDAASARAEARRQFGDVDDTRRYSARSTRAPSRHAEARSHGRATAGPSARAARLRRSPAFTLVARVRAGARASPR